MVEVLAALSISAAAGMRIALPLLLIGFLHSDKLWTQVPLLARVPQPVVLGVLVSWSLSELLLLKQRMGQRLLQVMELVFSPGVGAIAGITVARTAQFEPRLIWLVGLIGGLLALVLQLVQVGWFFRLRGLPLWVILLQDFLCVVLVVLAFDAPTQGGLIALLLLWITIRSSTQWRHRYRRQAGGNDRRNPRRYKVDPD